MTKTVNIKDIPTIQVAIDMTKNGDEIVVEDNGKPIIKVVSVETAPIKERVFGIGAGKTWMSDDFDDELPDEFWGFDKEL